MIKSSYDKFTVLLEKFIEFKQVSGDVVVNPAIIGKICERIDQRKDYFMYYHSEEGNVMHMSHEKEIALWTYWVCKYKPVHFAKRSDDSLFFTLNGCTLSDAFAVYLMISVVCDNKPKRAKKFTPDRINDIFYDFTNRDFSKEAVMSKITDLLA